jgi:uncharacterized membrane protein YkvI
VTDRFRRWILPGLAFKAVIIGGGYATGRELAEFFLPSGPWGGLAGMIVAATIWSAVSAATFTFARATGALDYRQFFQALLGRFWWLFEVCFLALLIVALGVFAAAAGAIGATLFHWPPLLGTLALTISIAAFSAFGNRCVEELFKYASFLLYGVYAAFLGIALWLFGGRIGDAFAAAGFDSSGILGGVAYSGYSIVGAVVILPVVRHMRSSRDAMVAGLIAGPLAILPAILFYVCMTAWPAVKAVELPSDYLLQQLDVPVMRYAFQMMIFAALLESGTGTVHAFNQRVAGALAPGRRLTWTMRLLLSTGLLVGSVWIAQGIGLVRLIGQGYRYLSYVILAVYVAPLLSIGLWRLRTGVRPQDKFAAAAAPPTEQRSA